MKKILTLALAAAMALSLAACGGSGSSAPAGSSAAGSSAAGSSSAADSGIGMTSGNVEEHSLQAIKDRGVLAQALADDLGVELKIENIDFNSVVPEVQAGNADMAIADLTPNEDRKQSVDMSNIYYGGGQCMLVLEENL